MTPADCHTGQRVLYQGRVYTVSALAGDLAVLADGAVFRTVPIAELTPSPTDGQIENTIRDIGADALPDPDWQQKVWHRIAARRRRRILFVVVALISGALIVWWLAVGDRP